jgi:hypothetical protein
MSPRRGWSFQEFLAREKISGKKRLKTRFTAEVEESRHRGDFVEMRPSRCIEAPCVGPLFPLNRRRFMAYFRITVRPESRSSPHMCAFIRTNPRHEMLAALFWYSGRSAHAAETYMVCIVKEPDDAQPYCGRGQVFAELARFGEAARDLDRALAAIRGNVSVASEVTRLRAQQEGRCLGRPRP